MHPAVYRPGTVAPMDASERFAAVVSAPDAEVRLDLGALCVAAHAHPGLDVDEWCGRIDDLAAGCGEPTFAGVREHLFDRLGYTGDRETYHDPENSFLDSVVERRRGIPITLSILLVEVARRVGVTVLPVGMPGHFLVTPADARQVWCDPFHGGELLDEGGCRRLFAAVHGSAAAFHPAHLAPTPRRLVLARVLANLERGPLARDPRHLDWICALRLSIPDLPDVERARLRSRLVATRARWN